MGDSLQQWRGAIGCFSALTTRAKSVKKRKKKASVFVSNPIILGWTRLLSVFLLTTSGLTKSSDEDKQRISTSSPDLGMKLDIIYEKNFSILDSSGYAALTSKDVSPSFENINYDITMTNSMTQDFPQRPKLNIMRGKMNVLQILTVPTTSQVRRLLRLCNDVETNPGPSPDQDEKKTEKSTAPKTQTYEVQDRTATERKSSSFKSPGNYIIV